MWWQIQKYNACYISCGQFSTIPIFSDTWKGKSSKKQYCWFLPGYQIFSSIYSAEIHGTITNPHKSRRGHYKTCIGIKYEEKKTFLNSDYKSKLVLYYLTSLIRDVTRTLTALGCDMCSYQTRQIKGANKLN